MGHRCRCCGDGGVGCVDATGGGDTLKAITVTGVLIVPSGLGYPGVGVGGAPDPAEVPCTNDLAVDPSCVTVTSGPKGDPVVGMAPEGNHSGFSFSSVVCVKASLTTNPDKKTPGPALCATAAAGAIWGYCGLATGVGTATITNLGPPPLTKSPETISTAFSFTEVAGVWYLTGGNVRTWLSGALTARPVPTSPGGPSCLEKTANSFQMEGELVYKDLK